MWRGEWLRCFKNLMPKRGTALAAAALGLTLVAMPQSEARAGDVSWNNLLGGDLLDDANWLPAEAPGPADTAVFDLGSNGYWAWSIGSLVTQSLEVRTDLPVVELGPSNTWTLGEFSDAQALRVAPGTNDVAVLSLVGGRIQTPAFALGSGAGGGASGGLELDGPTTQLVVTSTTTSSDVGAGASNSGQLVVNHGAQLLMPNSTLALGKQGASALLHLNNASFGDVGSLLVGGAVGAEVFVERGSQLHVNDMSVSGIASPSTVNVSTFDATLEVEHGLSVGNSLGVGQLAVENGAVRVGGTLDVVVAGSSLKALTGATVEAAGLLKVWDGAALRIEGGEVTARDWILSAGSTFDLASGAAVVRSGAFVDLRGGTTSIDGQAAGSLSRLVFTDGAQGSFTDVIIGENNSGELNILRGSHVTTNSASIGRFAGSDGEVSVSAFNATWDIAGNLGVGNHFGVGTLQVENGTVTVGSDLDVLVAGSRLLVQPGGYVQSDETLRVWPGATVQVDAGLVEAKSLELKAGSQLLLNSGQIVVDGGLFTDQRGATLTIDSASPAAVAQIALTNAATADLIDVVIGESNVGRLDILRGSQLRSHSARLGRFAGSNGHVTVSAFDAAWEIADDLIVGSGLGTGLLEIENGSVTVAGQTDVLVSGSAIRLLPGGRLISPEVTAHAGALLEIQQGEIEASSLVLSSGALRGQGRVQAPVLNRGEVFPDDLVVEQYSQLVDGELSLSVDGRVTPRMTIEGAAEFNGRLELTLEGSPPSPGYVYSAVLYATHSGEFADIAGARFGPGATQFFAVLYGSDSLDLYVPLCGDANLDGIVSGADYTIWADHYEMPNAAYTDGDFNGDGFVSGADYTIWADHYGDSARSAAVPEPATIALAAIMGIGLLLQPRILKAGAPRRRGRHSIEQLLASHIPHAP